jgi:hypothetical protein
MKSMPNRHSFADRKTLFIAGAKDKSKRQKQEAKARGKSKRQKQEAKARGKSKRQKNEAQPTKLSIAPRIGRPRAGEGG